MYIRYVPQDIRSTEPKSMQVSVRILYVLPQDDRPNQRVCKYRVRMICVKHVVNSTAVRYAIRCAEESWIPSYPYTWYFERRIFNININSASLHSPVDPVHPGDLMVLFGILTWCTFISSERLNKLVIYTRTAMPYIAVFLSE